MNSYKSGHLFYKLEPDQWEQGWVVVKNDKLTVYRDRVIANCVPRMSICEKLSVTSMFVYTKLCLVEMSATVIGNVSDFLY
jgi:hypothetical protein